jgi:hypothetical protein
LDLGVVGDAAVELASTRHAVAEDFSEGLQAVGVERGRLSPVSYQRVGFH